jgi:ABC-type phosphate/phosphonate transport system substrate-binding protein
MWKRRSLLNQKLFLTAAALLSAAAVLTGCGAPAVPAASSAASSAAASPADTPLTIETLQVELPRTLDTQAGRAAMEALPARLAEQGVEVGAVSVTFGTSYAATAAALDQGGVQLAFLPAADFVKESKSAVPLLADAYALPEYDADPAAWSDAYDDSDVTAAGAYLLLCTAPTAYGENLAARTASGHALSLRELQSARWGCTETGLPYLELWLEDHCEGGGCADLPQLTAYDDWGSLLRAAAAGDVDALLLPPNAREDYAALWTMDVGKTDAGGSGGFGRSADIFSEVRVIGVTERLYTFVAAVTPEDPAVNSPQFQQALETALEQVFADDADRLAAIGAERYAAVAPENLDGLRRLTFGQAT